MANSDPGFDVTRKKKAQQILDNRKTNKHNTSHQTPKLAGVIYYSSNTAIIRQCAEVCPSGFATQKMVFINGVKYACVTCIKGHRSTACHHSDRPLQAIKRKGRPITQCAHCRELRKTQKLVNGGLGQQFKIIEFNQQPRLPAHLQSQNQQQNCEDKHSVEALLNPCQCTTGAKCICCRPVEQEINEINISVANNILDNNNININSTSTTPTTSDFSFSSTDHPIMYNQLDNFNRFFATTATPPSNSTTPITATATTDITGSPSVGDPMSLNRSNIGPLAGEIIGQNAITVAQFPAPSPFCASTSQQINSRFYSPKVTDHNNISWNSGGYLSDGSVTSLSALSESTMSYQPRNFYKHRRIASYPSLSYPLPKLETQNTVGGGIDLGSGGSIISDEPRNYNSYHDENEKSMTDESGVLGEQFCHSSPNELVDMIYSSFQNSKSSLLNGSCCGSASAPSLSLSTTTAVSGSATSSSICRCGANCKCQGCQTHPRGKDAAVGNIDRGVQIAPNFQSQVIDSRNVNMNMSINGGDDVSCGGGNGMGNCCSSSSQSLLQPKHTIIADEDGVLLCGCGCRKPNTDCSDCIKNLCEGIYLILL
ncbi:13868_t:CDS:2 [Ambispora leptoticha]|uniref:13868_t:CDS:1 n=1 Tax=Ambispora leptoticha TaxID=144679 RepID=A0A9N9CGV6_9GLOM|nr:13868_t:CDS:2 [Ambispora leptoticha]